MFLGSICVDFSLASLCQLFYVPREVPRFYNECEPYFDFKKDKQILRFF